MRQVVVHFGTRALIGLSVLLAACSQPAATPTAQPAAAAKPTSAPAAAQPAASSGGNLVFFSNQFKPVAEQAKMQDIILKEAPVKADFIPEDPGPFNDRLNAEEKAGKVTVSLVGSLHGDMEPFVRAGYLEDLT